MAEYVAGRGTTALGIVGTVLGSIGTAAAAGGMSGVLGGNRNYEQSCATMHDIADVKELAAKDAEIARLNGERYADSVGIALYKELKADINALDKEQGNHWTEQAVINANVTNGLTALSAQATNTANVVAQITKTAVPTSAICNFGGGCTACGNNQ